MNVANWVLIIVFWGHLTGPTEFYYPTEVKCEEMKGYLLEANKNAIVSATCVDTTLM